MLLVVKRPKQETSRTPLIPMRALTESPKLLTQFVTVGGDGNSGWREGEEERQRGETHTHKKGGKAIL